MKQKMKAAVVVQFGKPLELQEWDIPTPGPAQILVKTEACGVCHTDVHAWHGDWPVKPTPPFIPGLDDTTCRAGLDSKLTCRPSGRQRPAACGPIWSGCH